MSRYLPSEEVPVLFDYQTYQPLSFLDGEYLPLVTEEDTVEFVLIPGIILTMEDGTGLPDYTFLSEELGYSPAEATALISDMSSTGFNTTGGGFGTPIPGDFTITGSEISAFIDAVDEFNALLDEMSKAHGVVLVDIHRLWDPDEPNAFGGYSGEFVFDDPANTIFSLNGVHPNNPGQTLIANAFIEKINEILMEEIPALDPEEYAGQYAQNTGLSDRSLSLDALMDVGTFFRMHPIEN